MSIAPRPSTAARFLRSSLHGFVALEAAGGFGLPRDLDRSFDHLVSPMDRALTGWPGSHDVVGGTMVADSTG